MRVQMASEGAWPSPHRDLDPEEPWAALSEAPAGLQGQQAFPTRGASRGSNGSPRLPPLELPSARLTAPTLGVCPGGELLAWADFREEEVLSPLT